MRYFLILLGLIFVVIAFNQDDYWCGFWYALAAACSILVSAVLAFIHEVDKDEDDEDDMWETW